MAVGCGASFAKFILLLVNIIFILSGASLAAIGIWLLVDPNIVQYIQFAVADHKTLFTVSAALLIAMGALVLLVSILGFVGACCEKRSVLGVYIGFLAFIFAGEIAAGIVAIIYQEKIRENLDKSLEKTLAASLTWVRPYYERYNVSDGSYKCKASSDAQIWDLVQIQFDCCGVHNDPLSGYENSSITEFCPELAPLPASRPVSCCQLNRQELKNEDISEAVQDQAKMKTDNFDCRYYKSQGCADVLIQWINTYAPALIGIGIGIAMFQMLVIIFALCLCQHIKYHDDM